jgi:thiol-disulfide isomerase/thioredoxin
VGALVVFLLIFLSFFIFLRFSEDTSMSPPAFSSDQSAQKPAYMKYKELQGIAGYINTDPITIGELIGKKVILVDIWTYSCINCQRTLPYITAWYDKYQDDGLEIIGVHTPEFAFEKNIDNVRRAVDQWGIKYPVVLDNEYGTWNAYNNRFWPRKYLIDIYGNIVYDHIGEGGYGETEQKIQEFLAERAMVLGENIDTETGVTIPEGVETVDPRSVRSPETYFGTLRQSYPALTLPPSGTVATFEEPKQVKLNTLYLVGDWKFTGEYAEAAGPNAKIIFKYDSNKIFLVASAEDGTTMSVFRDGQPIGDVAGRHVEDGVVEVGPEQLYRLIEDPNGGEHILELKIEKPGFRAFAFTFG